jgi:hypothetical protein
MEEGITGGGDVLLPKERVTVGVGGHNHLCHASECASRGGDKLPRHASSGAAAAPTAALAPAAPQRHARVVALWAFLSPHRLFDITLGT